MKKRFFKTVVVALFVSVVFSCEDPVSSVTNDDVLIVSTLEPNFFGSGFDASIRIVKNGSYSENANNTVMSGDTVKGATVKINDNYAIYDSFWDEYKIDSLSLTPGDTVLLEISHADFTLDVTATVPYPVVLTTPVESDTFSDGEEVSLVWSPISSQPDELNIQMSWMQTLDEEARLFQINPSATSYTIQSGIIDFSDNFDEFDINSINRVYLELDGIDSNSQLKIINTLSVDI